MSIVSAVTSYLRRPVQPGPTYSHADRVQAYAAAAQAIASFRIGKPTWPDRDPATLDSAGYRRVALVFRCLNLVSHTAGTAPVRVYDEALDGETLPDHPLRLLLRQPNPEMGEAVFWANVTLRTGIAGFCVVEKERYAVGSGVKALWPLNSSWLRAVPREMSRPDWEYRIPGISQPYRLRAEDVIPFRWADTPDGSPYGIGPIAIGLRSAALITKMIDFLGVLFERGGVPMWGLIPDLMPGQTLNQEQVDVLTERFLERHGGIERAAIPAILAGIKDIKRLGFDLDELAYTDLRDVSELEILQAFGVPARKAMTRVGLEHVTQNATATVEDAEFYRDTMLPLWTRFDDALSTSLLPDFEAPGSSRSLEFDTSDIAALQPDRNERAKWLVPLGLGGGVTIHTVHRELGLPLPPGADFYLRPLNTEVVPVEPEEDAPLSRALRAGERRLPLQGVVTSIRDVTAHTGPQRRYAAAQTNRRLFARVAEARAPSIGRYFRAQGERIIAAVRAPVGVAALAGLVVANGHPGEAYSLVDVDWAEEQYRLAQVLDRLYTLAGETAVAAVADQLGLDPMSWDLTNPKIAAVLDRVSTRPDGPVGITAESRRRVTQILADGQQAGLGIDEIAANLRAQFATWSEGRARRIARTEAMVSYGEASVLAYQESGIVDRAQIFDNPNHTEAYGASDGLTCATRDGIVVPLERAMDHIYADHPNGSATAAPVLVGEVIEEEGA